MAAVAGAAGARRGAHAALVPGEHGDARAHERGEHSLGEAEPAGRPAAVHPDGGGVSARAAGEVQGAGQGGVRAREAHRNLAVIGERDYLAEGDRRPSAPRARGIHRARAGAQAERHCRGERRRGAPSLTPEHGSPTSLGEVDSLPRTLPSQRRLQRDQDAAGSRATIATVRRGSDPGTISWLSRRLPRTTVACQQSPTTSASRGSSRLS
jgi:hypothetical protein